MKPLPALPAAPRPAPGAVSSSIRFDEERSRPFEDTELLAQVEHLLAQCIQLGPFDGPGLHYPRIDSRRAAVDAPWGWVVRPP